MVGTMKNRFLEMDDYLNQNSGKKGGRSTGGYAGTAGGGIGVASSLSYSWAQPFSAQDRVLVILIDNGGIDLGIPALVDQLLSLVPGSILIPDDYRQNLIGYIRDKIKSLTDNLLESLELSVNRYAAAKPDFFGDVVILRDGTASYQDLKDRLLALSRAGKIVDLFILTHGWKDLISVAGQIDSQKIRSMKAENGKPLSIRSVYMMNCVGASLNQAWIDAGAKVSSGALGINYLPEPTMYFFWQNWKEGQTFENAVTSAYRKTINLMNEAVRTFLIPLPIPGAGLLGPFINFENMDFVKQSAPVIQGQRNVTINSDELTFSQSTSCSLATTVLPTGLLSALAVSRSTSDTPRQLRMISQPGIDFIKGWEGFRAKMYNDPVGHCTIGYGTLLHTGNCDGRPSEQAYINGISEEDATQLLMQRAGEFQQIVNDSVTVALNQNQNDALVSLAYNIGGGNFQKSTLLKRLNDGNYDAVPTEMKKWTKARQKGQLVDLPGLVKRRAAEAELFQKPTPATTQSLPQFGRGPYAQSLSAIDYTIPGFLPVIPQSKLNDCWAAVFTMMYIWKHDDKSIGIRDALATVGPNYVNMFDNDIALNETSAKAFYSDAGLVPIYSFNPTIEGWTSFLKKYGPLYVDVGYNTRTRQTHAIIVTGISGDGSPDNTSITYVDPLSGTTSTRKFRDFLAKFEAQSAVNWPYTIVHWPPGAQKSLQNSLAVQHSYEFHSPSFVNQQSNYSTAQNPVAAVIAGLPVADAASIGLAAVAIVQAQANASAGTFILTFDKAQRLLTSEARAHMPGSQVTKQQYSRHLFEFGINALNAATADVIIEWEGNPYGEITTPILQKKNDTSTDWSKSSANINVIRRDSIPLPQTDPRTWPIVYWYQGTYDPWGNGYFEFSGEFEINAFGGLKFNKHEVVSRSAVDWAIGGSPEDKVQKGQDVIVPVPAIPQEQIDYLRTKLP